MGACDTWNVEINILVCENEMFSLPCKPVEDYCQLNWLMALFILPTSAVA